MKSTLGLSALVLFASAQAQQGPLAGGPLAGGPQAGGPLAGGPLAGGPLAGGPLAGGPQAGGPLAGGPLAGGPQAGGPLAGGPLGPGPSVSGCPSPRLTVQNQSPVASKNFACPSNDGELYETSNGHHMYMQCCTDRSHGRLIAGIQVSTFGECMDQCTQESTGECRSVSFGGSRPENCILWAAGGFATDQVDDTHHAFLVDPPTAEHADDDIKLCTTECPYSHNQVFTSDYGEAFRMVCGKRHGTTAIPERADSYEACMNMCGRVTQCKSVDYHHRTKKCYIGDHGGEPAIDAPGFSSAVSVGCAGACNCKEYSKPEPRVKEPPCPTAQHGALWVIDGKAWKGHCIHKAVNGNSFTLHDGPATAEDCMKLCQNHGHDTPWDQSPLAFEPSVNHIDLEPLEP